MKRLVNIGGVVCIALVVAPLMAAGPEDDKDAAKPELPKCPVMGEAIDFAISADTDEGPVYFCCKRCIRKFEGNPGKYADATAEQHAALKKMPRMQVSCPISGEPIDPAAFAEVDGEKVYACCDKCAAKIAAEPNKYKAGLASAYSYQTVCPVMGKAAKPTQFTPVGDGRVYFCCKRCVKAFANNPAKFAPELEAQGYGKLAKTAVDQSDK